MQRVAARPLPELTRAAKTRLAWMDHYARHGNVSFTCRHFGISRQTFYVWQRRYDPRDLRRLEARSPRPKRTRPRTWTDAQVQAVRELREQYPCWGKDKLARLLPKALQLSVSKVGRILASLRARGQLVEPPRRLTPRRPAPPRPYARRKPRDYQPTAPGDLVEIDTLDVRPSAGHVLKQFTATDVISRHGALELASAATATLATRVLDALARLPFPVRAVQIDGGREFKGAFEAACEQRGLPLFVLPPRSPKLNGHVERSQRTHTEEFYGCTTAPPTLAALRPALAEWETVYNTIRPHQALGYLTPLQFWAAYQRDPDAALAALPQNQPRTPRKEPVSGT
jgi:transposase InsO family protein